MGYTNAVTIQQSNVTFILMDEMPEHAACFIDDVVAKGTRSYYKKEDGTYETHPENPGVRRFVWEHAQTINRVLHRLGRAGASVSGKKAVVAAEEKVEQPSPTEDNVQSSVLEEATPEAPSQIEALPEPQEAVHKVEETPAPETATPEPVVEPEVSEPSPAVLEESAVIPTPPVVESQEPVPETTPQENVSAGMSPYICVDA